MGEPQSQSTLALSEAERLDAALAALQAERARRGKWPAVSVTIVDEGKKPSDFPVEATPEFKYPPEHIELHVVDPDPQIELPSMQWDQPDAMDVTPSAG